MKKLEDIQDLYKKAVEAQAKKRKPKIKEIYDTIMEKAEQKFLNAPNFTTDVSGWVQFELAGGLNTPIFKGSLKDMFVKNGFHPNRIRFSQVSYNSIPQDFIEVDFS
jgi:hypothetical protein